MGTLADISKETGLAVATISEILRNKPGYNASTRQRVLEAARRLNYQPNLIGRALKGGRTQTLGVLVSSLQTPISVIKLQAIEEAARASGYMCYACRAHPDDDQAAVDAIRHLMARCVDGLIVHLVAAPPLPAIELLANLPVPVVYLEWAPPGARYSVQIDRQAAMREVAAHLAQLGHRQVRIAPTPSDVYNPALKVDPYRQALKDAGLEMAGPWDRVLDPQDITASAYAMVCSLIESGQLPTALLMNNDEGALAAIAALHDAGLRVPADVSVVGFDDLAVATYCRPALTTVHLPRAEVGQAAFQMLLAAMTGQAPDTASNRFPCHLVVRQSTGPARAGPLSPRHLQSTAPLNIPEAKKHRPN